MNDYYDMSKNEKRRGYSYHGYNGYGQNNQSRQLGRQRDYSNKNQIIPKIKHSNRNIILERLIEDKKSAFIPEQIMDILRRGTARIEFDGNKRFTSFFMKIEIKKEQHNFLLTCAHCITKNDIYSQKNISVIYGKINKEKKVQINLDKKKRFIKAYNSLDVTLIELLSEDNIPDKYYLYPDLNYKNKGFNNYENIQVYTAGFPEAEIYEKDRQMSTGKIKTIKDFEFEHTCDTRKGSSGCPIINYSGNVIGIHYGGDKDKGINYGYFIGAIIERIKKENITNLDLDNDLKNKNLNNFNKFNKMLKSGIQFMGPLLYDHQFLSYVQKFYQQPSNIEILKKMPIIKDNPTVIENLKDSNKFEEIMKKENVDNLLKKMGIELPEDN